MRRLIAAVLLTAAVLPAASCDDDDDQDVRGTWFFNMVSQDVYLRITESTYEIFQVPIDGCVEHTVSEIVDVDGSTYTLAPADDPQNTVQVRLRRSGSNLLIGPPDSEESNTWEPSDVDVDEFQLCET